MHTDAGPALLAAPRPSSQSDPPGSWVDEVVSTLERETALLDADLIAPGDVERLVRSFTRVEHLAKTCRTILARRVLDAGIPQRQGSKDDADALARLTGQPKGAAVAELKASRALESSPELDSAARAGRLSGSQLGLVADAVLINKDAAGQLIESAERDGYTTFKKHCEAAKAAGMTAAEHEMRDRHIKANQSYRAFTDVEGFRNIHLRGLATDLAPFEALVASEAKGAFERARRAGERHRQSYYDVEAVLAITDAATCTDTRTAPRRKSRRDWRAILLVNVESLARGSTAEGETCEIAGVGPISVAAARKLLGDSTLELVIRDGNDIATHVHLGRAPTEAQRTAILVRDGGRCVVCQDPGHEMHHVDGWIVTKTTPLNRLGMVCNHHHDQITHRGATLERAPDGTWTYTPAPTQHPTSWDGTSTWQDNQW